MAHVGQEVSLGEVRGLRFFFGVFLFAGALLRTAHPVNQVAVKDRRGKQEGDSNQRRRGPQ